jgi:hypothetical protein
VVVEEEGDAVEKDELATGAGGPGPGPPLIVVVVFVVVDPSDDPPPRVDLSVFVTES